MAQKSYSFNNNHFRMPQIKHMKEINRRGLNAVSGNFPAGSNVRIRNKRPG